MRIAIAVCMAMLTAACSSVHVTKTNEGFYDPTDANRVQILKTLPDPEYIELGTVTAAQFDVGDSAKMHNGIRAKSAGLGAHAVVLTDEGVDQGKKWATGVAIRYKQ